MVKFSRKVRSLGSRKKTVVFLILVMLIGGIFFKFLQNIVRADDEDFDPPFFTVTAPLDDTATNLPFNFEFNVSDNLSNISFVECDFGDGTYIPLDPIDGLMDSTSEDFSHEVTGQFFYDYITFPEWSGYEHSIYCNAEDSNFNSNYLEQIIYIEDLNSPEIEFDTFYEGSFLDDTPYYSFTVSDSTSLFGAFYRIDNNEPVQLFYNYNGFDTGKYWESFELYVDYNDYENFGQYLEDGQEHNISFFVGNYDLEGNSINISSESTYVIRYGESEPPTISFNQQSEGLIQYNLDLFYDFYVEDSNSTISSITYSVDDGDNVNVIPYEGTLGVDTYASARFYIPVTKYDDNQQHSIEIKAEDGSSNIATSTFSFEIDPDTPEPEATIGNFSATTPLPTSLRDHEVLVVPANDPTKNTILVLGGRADNSNNTATNKIWYSIINESNGELGSWEEILSPYNLTESVWNHSVAYVEVSSAKYVYVVGGTTSLGDSNKIYKLGLTGGEPSIPRGTSLLATSLPFPMSGHSSTIMEVEGLKYLYISADNGNNTEIWRSEIQSNGDLGTFELEISDPLPPDSIANHSYKSIMVGGNLENTQFLLLSGGGTYYDEWTPQVSTSFILPLDANVNAGQATIFSDKYLDLESILIQNDDSAYIFHIGGTNSLDTNGISFNSVLYNRITYSPETTSQWGNNPAFFMFAQEIDEYSSYSGYTFNQQTQLPTGLYGHEAVSINIGGKDYLYILGGANENSESRSIVYKSLIATPNTVNNTPPEISFTHSAEGDVGEIITFAGTGTSYHGNIDVIEYEVDGNGDRRYVSPSDGNEYDSSNEDFNFEINTIYENWTEGSHTIVFYIRDAMGNVNDYSFNVNIVLEEEDTNSPTIIFTHSRTGLVPTTFRVAGIAEDSENTLESLQYEIDNQGRKNITPEDGSLDGQVETFDFYINAASNVDNISNGNHVLKFYVKDTQDNENTYQFDIDMDQSKPYCDWVNLPMNHNSTIITYENVECHDNRSITSAEYRVYHSVHGEIIPWGEGVLDQSDDGNWGGSSETFSFSIDLSEHLNIDGPLGVYFKAIDEAGNESFDNDPLIYDVVDNTPPELNLNSVIPNPLADTTPTISGSCRDNAFRDTNSNIHLLEYKLGDEDYSAITLPNHRSYDQSSVETFTFDLPEIGAGEYTVTVRCSDQGNLSTEVSTDFEIQIPLDPQPGEYSHTENFIGHTGQDIPNSENIIWGNGKLRLKEDITVTNTQIDINGYCDRYATCWGDFSIHRDPIDSNILWFPKPNGTINSYNVSTATLTTLSLTDDFGVPVPYGVIWAFDIGVYDGKKYLFFADEDGITGLNLTDQVGIHTNSYTGIKNITLDFGRGRMGMYVRLPAAGGDTSIAYWDLNETLTNSGDDTFARIPINPSGFNSTSADTILPDFELDTLYVSSYHGDISLGRIYKLNDNNTPFNYGDDQAGVYESGDYNSVFSGMTLDPDKRLIFGTANNSNGRLFVVTDTNNTEYETDDDTIIQLAHPQKLDYRNIYGITYIEGVNGVGDQLFIKTEGSQPIYLNFNDTYDDLLDDTVIVLDTTNGQRPVESNIIVHDYNTIFSLNENQGLYRSNLIRGWEDNGDAVGVPTRPPETLVVNNFVADATETDPISTDLALVPQYSLLDSFLGIISPKVSAAVGDPVRYFVSINDGITWSEVTLGELQQLQNQDYRVKFKISLAEIGNATPVLNSYTLEFAGYGTPEQAEELTTYEVVPSTTTIIKGYSFGLTINALDSLGYQLLGHNGSVTITLIDSITNETINSLNVGLADLVNGTVTLNNAVISQAGSFKIRVSDGVLSADSVIITVNEAQDPEDNEENDGSNNGAEQPSPSLFFWADRYIVQKGDKINLSWNSNYLNNLTIQPNIGSVSTSGTFETTLESTTTFTITGSGNSGNLSASFIVKVVDTESEIPSYPTSFPTPDANDEEVEELSIESSADQHVFKGSQINIWWKVKGNPESVYIDYLGRNVAEEGSYDLIAEKDIVITITARRGEEVVEKSISITILKLPFGIDKDSIVGEILRVSNDLKELPVLSIAGFALLQAAIGITLMMNIISVVGTANLSLKTISNVFMVSGLLPFKKRRGYVYLNKTTKFIPFVTISINSGSKVIATLITDLKGAYYEPFLNSGEYIFEAAHSEYNFPTNIERPLHLSKLDYYKGETIVVGTDKEQQAVVIPMDGIKNNEPNGLNKENIAFGLSKLLVWLQWSVYPLAILSVIVATLYPSLLNFLVAVIYLVVFGIKITKRLRRPSMSGKVVDSKTNSGLEGAVIQIRNNKRELVGVTTTDKNGSYKFFVPKEKYSVSITSENYSMEQGFGAGLSADLTLGNKFEFRMNRI